MDSNIIHRETPDKPLYERLLSEKDARIAELTAALEHEREQSRCHAEAHAKLQATLQAMITEKAPQRINPVSTPPTPHHEGTATTQLFPLVLNAVSSAAGNVVGVAALSVLALAYSLIAGRVGVIMSWAEWIALIGFALLMLLTGCYIETIVKEHGTIAVPVFAAYNAAALIAHTWLTGYFAYLFVWMPLHSWNGHLHPMKHLHDWFSAAVWALGFCQTVWFSSGVFREAKNIVWLLKMRASASSEIKF